MKEWTAGFLGAAAAGRARPVGRRCSRRGPGERCRRPGWSSRSPASEPGAGVLPRVAAGGRGAAAGARAMGRWAPSSRGPARRSPPWSRRPRCWSPTWPRWSSPTGPTGCPSTVRWCAGGSRRGALALTVAAVAWVLARAVAGRPAPTGVWVAALVAVSVSALVAAAVRCRWPSEGRGAAGGAPWLTGGPEEYVEAVLSLVERIPAGRVTTYGAIAEVVGGGPRQVGVGDVAARCAGAVVAGRARRRVAAPEPPRRGAGVATPRRARRGVPSGHVLIARRSGTPPTDLRGPGLRAGRRAQRSRSTKPAT